MKTCNPARYTAPLRTLRILTKWTLCLLFFLIIATRTSASTAVDIVNAALDELSSQRLDHWRFSAIERTNSQVLRMVYHPVRNNVGRIELVSINGREPTAKESDRFAKSHPPRMAGESSQHGYALGDLITPDTLQWHSSEDGIDTFHFTPRFAFAGITRSDYPMKGTLRFDSQSRQLISFDIRTTTSFRPKRGTRVDQFYLTIDFDAHANGTLLTQRIRTRLEGKAFWLFTLIQDIEIFFYDYLPTSQP